MNWIIHTQISAAFDNNMTRDPDRDDWTAEDVGMVPRDLLEAFCRRRYQAALRIIAVPVCDSAAQR